MDIRNILADRQQTHGHFPNVSYVSQRMKELFRSQENWHNLTDAQREMMDMVASKFGRILSGNTSVVDHYKDVSGYAELCVLELEQNAPAAFATPRTVEDIAPSLRRDYSKSKSLADRVAELSATAQAAE